MAKGFGLETPPGIDCGLKFKIPNEAKRDGLNFSESPSPPDPAWKLKTAFMFPYLEEMESKSQIKEKPVFEERQVSYGGEGIVKQGLVKKNKFFPRKKILLITRGPHLYYADPATPFLRKEIPLSPKLWVEVKNLHVFLVHAPNKTYYFKDSKAYAAEWAVLITLMCSS